MDKPINLGQPVFVLSPQGDIVRTIIARIGPKGDYRFANGKWWHQVPHYFTYEESVAAATVRINDKIEQLRREQKRLEARKRYSKTDACKSGVLSSLITVADLRDPKAYKRKRIRARTMKEVSVPADHLQPGACVYAVITPRTDPHGGLVYRPHQYYVLETEVTHVCILPTGDLHYEFTTRFEPEEHFPSREEAEERVRSILELKPRDPVHFVSHMEEAQAILALDVNLPF